MSGAKMAITANARTTVSPAIPRRVPRMTPKDRRIVFVNRVSSRSPASAEPRAPSETDTRIEYSIQDVGHDVSENHQDGNDPEERSRQELVLSENRSQEVVPEAEIG